MKLLQLYLAEPTDMSHLCDQEPTPFLLPLFLSLSPSLTEQKKKHLSTDVAAYYQLKCVQLSGDGASLQYTSGVSVCGSVYFGAAEIIDDTLLRNNLPLMLQACDCRQSQ